MSRVDLPDDAGRLRRALDDPWRLCEALGLTERAKRQRAGLSVLCPWHGEKTPSCSVSLGPDGTVRVRCFGCGRTGDALSLVAAVRGLDLPRDFQAVLVEASHLAGVQLGDPHREIRRPVEGRSHATAPAPLSAEAFAELVAPLLRLGRLDDGELAADVVRYLDGRRLLALARAEGWAALPRPESQAASVALLRELVGADALARSGLVRGSAFVEPAARVVIPWRDPKGRVYTLQRRRLDAAKPKYVIAAGRPARWPYGVDKLAAAPADAAIAIVEGAADALALAAIGAARGIAVVPLGLQGVASWSAEWGELARGRRAFVAVDADSAGERAVETIAADLEAGGAHSVQRWTPQGKDWADVLERS